jgi:glycosyltransferase
VIVGGPLAVAASLLSAEFGIPLATAEFGMAEPLNRQVATVEELRRLGFTHLPTPACSLVMCPESIRPPGSAVGEPMRYVSYAPAKPVEPWMYTKEDLPRVWISAGSRVSADHALDDLTPMIHAAADLDVELLIATPDHVAAQLGPLPPKARAGWMPFDVLAPTCDLAIHHGGGSWVAPPRACRR